jgi:hypothetical protein
MAVDKLDHGASNETRLKVAPATAGTLLLGADGGTHSAAPQSDFSVTLNGLGKVVRADEARMNAFQFLLEALAQRRVGQKSQTVSSLHSSFSDVTVHRRDSHLTLDSR